jgi:mono/diheme cytochrome c family protein
MKKTLALLSLLALAACVAVAEEDAPKLDGKTLYRTNCKVCHGPDADAGEYTPMYLIQEQWDTFFNETYVETHADLVMPGLETETQVLDHLTPEMIQAIHEFCIQGAADSESPMTCG